MRFMNIYLENNIYYTKYSLGNDPLPVVPVGVVVQVSTSPGFDRIWDRDGSGPIFDSVQDSTFVTNVVSVSNTSSIDIILLSHTSLIKID